MQSWFLCIKDLEGEGTNSEDEDSMSALSWFLDSDDLVSLSLESVSLDEDSVIDSVLTKTTVDRNVRNRFETMDTTQEVEMVSAKEEWHYPTPQ